MQQHTDISLDLFFYILHKCQKTCRYAEKYIIKRSQSIY